MKKLITFLFAGLAAVSLTAQRVVPQQVEGAHQKLHGMLQAKKTGFEVTTPSSVSVPPSKSGIRTSISDVIGVTLYDLQANASDNSRLINLGNGNLVGGFTISSVSGWADRGTGYNTASAYTFGADPTARVEAVRTGFPTLGVLQNGTHFAISHTGAGGLNFATKAASSTTWANTLIPATNAHFWPRSAVSGNTIHVICLTMPVGNGGTTVGGVDGLLHYWRSKDGGANWDKKEIVVADSTYNKTNDGEGYAIDVEGDNVAIVMGSLFSHVTLFKSTDGGDTWKKTYIYRMPIDFYEGDQGYDSTMIDTALSLSTDINSVFTSDGHLAVRVGKDGKAHVCYGAFYFNDADGATTPGFTWFPASVGTVYWNEDMGEDVAIDGNLAGIVIPAPLDFNNNGAWDVNLASDQYNDYGITAPQSMPTMGWGPNGKLYVGISLVDERFISTGDITQAFRHNYLFATGDYQNFGPGLDISFVSAPDTSLVPFTESAFPFLARDCSDKIHVLWQEDFKPGSDVTDATPAAEIQTSNIVYANFEHSEVTISQKDLLKPEAFKMSLMPNPVSDMLQVQLEFANKAENVQVLVVNMNGQIVMSKNVANLQNDRLFIPVGSIANGVYNLTIRTEQGVAAKKFTVLH